MADEGHLDFVIRTAITLGAPTLHAYRVATVSAARIFGLSDRGLVAPGYRADIVLLDDLEACRVGAVLTAGRVVDEALFAARPTVAAVGLTSVKAAPVKPSDFVPVFDRPTVPVIGVIPGKIITEHLTVTLPMRDGRPGIDFGQDVVKVTVIERHGRNGNRCTGFVKGFGLKRGAIASSVGHDSHNLCVVGADDADMALAANRVREMQGGFVVTEGGRVLGELALPVAGLMSQLPFEAVKEALIPLREAARSLGCTLGEPFLQVAFLPLPVIPHLKITDRGMVDVDRFAFVD